MAIATSSSGKEAHQSDPPGSGVDKKCRTVVITNFPAYWLSDRETLGTKVAGLLEKFGKLCEPPRIISRPCKLGTSDHSVLAYVTFEERDPALKAIKCLHGSDNRSGDEERLANYAPPGERQRYFVQKAACMPSKEILDDSQERSAKVARMDAPRHFLRVKMPRLRPEPPPLEELSLILQKQLYIISQCELPPITTESCGLLGPPPQLGLCTTENERVTLVLDLDGTLVECRPLTNRPASTQGMLSPLMVQLEHNQHAVYFRPKAKVFLSTVAQMFEVVVFTASIQSYADQVLDHLDPEGKLISYRLYRQHCIAVPCGPGQVVFLKDMSSLGRPIERVVLVDDSPISHVMTPDNGIVVSPWTADQDTDCELLDLLICLRECRRHVAEHGSVTEYLVQRYGLKSFFDTLRSFVKQADSSPALSQSTPTLDAPALEQPCVETVATADQ